jgi:hypothetical protein
MEFIVAPLRWWFVRAAVYQKSGVTKKAERLRLTSPPKPPLLTSEKAAEARRGGDIDPRSSPPLLTGGPLSTAREERGSGGEDVLL